MSPLIGGVDQVFRHALVASLTSENQAHSHVSRCLSEVSIQCMNGGRTVACSESNRSLGVHKLQNRSALGEERDTGLQLEIRGRCRRVKAPTSVASLFPARSRRLPPLRRAGRVAL